MSKSKSNKYNWKFNKVGGITRVSIETGEDIARLGELDQKLWTALSCPTTGFEFDETTLAYLDTNCDGRIHVNEVVAASKWLTEALRSPDSLLPGEDFITAGAINPETEAGKALLEGMANTLKVLGEEHESVSLADTAKALGILAEAAAEAKAAGEDVLPYGADTEEALGLAGKLKAIAFDKDYPGAEAITDADWQAVQGKLATYAGWKDQVKKEEDEFLESQKAEAETIKTVDKFLHLYRDFFRFLKNFVTFSDFYSRDESRLAVFQSGKLYIDERCLDLCVRVSDMARHGDMAGKSGMFILYCHCISKVKGAEMDIAGIVTEGNTRSLSVGQNAIFYDRDGHDWDATVTRILDNPISVPQAFWTPYRKFGKWCTDKLSKGAAERDDKATQDLVAKADGAKLPEEGAGKKQAFDIAKFAGIFAAIGMALGFILDAVVGLLDSIIKMPWWGFFVLVAAIILLISGPSMLLAWLKLRKRNLAPVLNANGWAINSRVLVNTQFGSTLTHLAEYPKVKGKDPFRKKTPLWRKIIRWCLLLLVLVVAAYWIVNKRLPWQKPVVEEIVIEEVITDEQPVDDADSAAEPVAEETAEPAA